jgi:TonB family protein
MSKEQEKKITPAQIGLGAVLFVVLGVGVYLISSILSAEAPKKRAPVEVTLLKLAPLPEIKQKPPEEIKQIPKKEEIIDTPQDQPKGPDADNAPAGDKLGLDADGAAGGDGFGLAARKGGRSLLAGGKYSLLSQYASYTQMVSNQIKKKIMKKLDDDGGIPKGKLQAIVRVSVNGDGIVIDYKILGSSGNHRMDEAVKLILPSVKISEPPPDGMPRTMDIKITSQG